MRIQNSRLLFIIVPFSLATIMVACGKDNFTTKPQLDFIKAENYEIPQGGLIEFKLDVTDKEGDLQDTIFIQQVVPSCSASNRAPYKYLMPAFPTTSNTKAEILITFVNGTFQQGYVTLPSPACGRPDTTTFKFWIKDKAQNVSDTVTTDKPLIIMN